MNMEKDLIKLKQELENKKYISFDEIVKLLEWSSKNKKNNRRIILSWLDNGDLVLVKQNKVGLPEKNGYFKGTFNVIKDKFAFVDIFENEEKQGIFIPKSAFNNALDGDIVLVKVTKEKKNNRGLEGEVIKIIEHQKKLVIGILEKNRNFSFVVPTRSIGRDIYIPKNWTKNAENKDLVAVEIIFWGDRERKPEGRIVQILGSIDNSKNMIDALIFRESLNTDFSNEAMQEVKNLKSKEKFEFSKIQAARKDLRKLSIITIDGDDSKDLDDAVFVEKLENNNYRLIVSIADVAHYIKFNSNLDKEARVRGNSVYLVDRVLPMFPKEISNGICSLNENEDKLTFTCEMKIDSQGNVVSSDIYKSIIKSKYRMTYSNVNKILDDDLDLNLKYKEIRNMLNEMLTLSKILRNKKYKRGSIDLDISEIKIILDEDEKVKEIKKRERGEAERIIEDFMIVANETVAERTFWLEEDSIYRIHEKPSRESMYKLNETLMKLGYKIPNLDNIHPKQFQDIIENSKKRDINMLAHKMILMSLKQARYSTENKGHFGLSSKCYTHFTSPIRRYSDLMVHRVLNKIISNSVEKGDTFSSELETICEHISKTERVAMRAEDESIRIKLVEYMSNKIGEVLDAIVVGFSQRKVFFESIDGIECSWDITTSRDYYEFDEENYLMKNRNNDKEVYNLGDKHRVILEKTNFFNLEIIVSPLEVN